jgi:hypothetical protein
MEEFKAMGKTVKNNLARRLRAAVERRDIKEIVRILKSLPVLFRPV